MIPNPHHGNQRERLPVRRLTVPPSPTNHCLTVKPRFLWVPSERIIKRQRSPDFSIKNSTQVPNVITPAFYCLDRIMGTLKRIFDTARFLLRPVLEKDKNLSWSGCDLVNDTEVTSKPRTPPQFTDRNVYDCCNSVTLKYFTKFTEDT